MRYAVLAICLAVACLTVQPAQAQVHVNIGINLPAPPQWVGGPGLPVYYAPGAPADVFQYNGQCYVLADGGWYVGPGYGGPWIFVAAQVVPAPLLRAPARHHHQPPGHRQERRTEHQP